MVNNRTFYNTHKLVKKHVNNSIKMEIQCICIQTYTFLAQIANSVTEQYFKRLIHVLNSAFLLGLVCMDRKQGLACSDVACCMYVPQVGGANSNLGLNDGYSWANAGYSRA